MSSLLDFVVKLVSIHKWPFSAIPAGGRQVGVNQPEADKTAGLLVCNIIGIIGYSQVDPALDV